MTHNLLRISFISYCILLAITLWRHEMWRDELEAWNIAVASSSITNLFDNFRYEGHPALWFIVLWVISKISIAPEMMQVINFLFAAITAGIILFKSPFSKAQRVLLIFGYYFLYEYAAISRNYMIEIMMAVLICALWKNSNSHRGWLILLLFLICQTNAFGYLLSFAFAISLFQREVSNSKNSIFYAVNYIIAAVAGFCVSYLSSALPEDSELQNYFVFSWDKNRLVQVLTNFWNGLIPIPRLHLPFWSEPMLHPSITGAVLGSVLLFAIVVLSLRNKKLLISFLIPAIFAMLVLMYSAYPGFQRHHGHLFIALVCFLWLHKSSVLRQVVTRVSFPVLNYLFNCLLILQAIVGIGFMLTDWLLPFSQGKATAAFIRKNYRNEVVAGQTDCPMTSVAGYLSRDVYFLNNLRYASFVIYRAGRSNVEDSTLFRNIFTLADSTSLMLVLNFDLMHNGQSFLPEKGRDTSLIVNTINGAKTFSISNKARFDGSMVGGEDFTVYRVKSE